MSTASVQQETCTYCDDRFTPPTGAPGYCRPVCRIRNRGRKVLNQIESDHRYCSTCYGLVKTTLPVKDKYTEGPDHPGHTSGPKRISDSVQFPTDRTTWGVDSFTAPSGAIFDPGERAYREVEGTRWSCICGSVDPNQHHGIIQRLEYKAAFRNLWRALEDAYSRGAIDKPPSFEPYKEAFTAPWRGVEYALGMAVDG